MPGVDPLAKLKALTKTEAGPSTFQHESEEDVLRRLTGIFARVPAGKALFDDATRHGVQIKLLKGKNDFSYSPETDTVWLGLPGGQTMPKARMLIHLFMGLKEGVQEHEGVPRPDIRLPEDQFVAIHVEKQHDILLAMVEFAHELITQLGLREILDELRKMGHIKLYEAYVEELQRHS